MNTNTYDGGYYENAWDQSNEQHELHEKTPINYNQQNYMTNEVHETSVETVNMDNNYDNNYGDKSGGYAQQPYMVSEESYILIWKYMEQIKSITAGLLLLFCAGLHIVWSIYQVLFYATSDTYRKHLERINSTKLANRIFERVMFSQRIGLMFTVIMWYVGVALGAFVAGYFLVRVVQKKNLYYVCVLVMFVGACLFYSADVADSGWQTLLLCGRLFTGLSHGMTYVTVFVQASENAARDFRRIIVTIIGGTIALSIFITSTFLIFVPVPDLEESEEFKNAAVESEIMSAGIIATTTFVICFAACIINYFFTLETVPFLLYHNYREEEAQFTLAKLLGEEPNAEIIQYEFIAIKEMCTADYAQFDEKSIFQSAHRSLLSIAASARIAAAQSFNVPIVVLFVKIIQAYYLGVISKNLSEIEEVAVVKDRNESVIVIEESKRNLVNLREAVHIYNTAVKTLLFSWFVFGLTFTLLGNYFNWKRGLHFTTFIAGASIVICVIVVFVGIFANFIGTLTFLVLIIYFQFLSLPVDIIGYTYLTECFPISTKARSIAFVTMCEALFSIILVSIDLRYYHNEPEFIPMGLILCALGYKLYMIVPNTNGFSLAAAKEAYLQASASKKWYQF